MSVPSVVAVPQQRPIMVPLPEMPPPLLLSTVPPEATEAATTASLSPADRLALFILACCGPRKHASLTEAQHKNLARMLRLCIEMAIKSVPDVNNSLQLRIRQAVQRDIATEERSTSTREASGRDGPAPTRHWLRYTKDIVEALCAAVVAHVATGYTHALLSIAPVVCAADASVPGLERVALEACGALTSFDWTPPAEFAKFITKSSQARAQNLVYMERVAARRKRKKENDKAPASPDALTAPRPDSSSIATAESQTPAPESVPPIGSSVWVRVVTRPTDEPHTTVSPTEMEGIVMSGVKHNLVAVRISRRGWHKFDEMVYVPGFDAGYRKPLKESKLSIPWPVGLVRPAPELDERLREAAAVRHKKSAASARAKANKKNSSSNGRGKKRKRKPAAGASERDERAARRRR